MQENNNSKKTPADSQRQETDAQRQRSRQSYTSNFYIHYNDDHDGEDNVHHRSNPHSKPFAKTTERQVTTATATTTTTKNHNRVQFQDRNWYVQEPQDPTN